MIKLASGTVHKMPKDLEDSLLSIEESAKAWEDITPLARNEWICRVEDAKKQKQETIGLNV